MCVGFTDDDEMRRRATLITTATTTGMLWWWYFGSGNVLSKSRPDCVLVFPRDPYKDWARATRTYLREKYGIRSELQELHLDDPEREEVILSIISTEAKAVIPFEVNVTEYVASELKELTSLCRDSQTILNLNDKAKQITLLSSSVIPQIPTLNLDTCTSSQLREFVANTKSRKFIVKPSQGAGSLHQTVLTREEAENTMVRLISNGLWNKPAVIQPLIEESYSTIEFNVFVDEEKHIRWIATHSPGGLSEKNWTEGVTLFSYDDKNDLDRILCFTRDVVERYELRGLMEFEFLRVRGDNRELYLLEVNPRVSSSIVAFDSDGNSPYIDNLLVPYIASLGVSLSPQHVDKPSSPQVDVWFPPELTASSYVESIWCGSSSGGGGGGDGCDNNSGGGGSSSSSSSSSYLIKK